jgi:putative transposase
MKRKRFTEKQVIKILRSHEAGVPLADLAREHGFAEGTIYTWKARYGGMEVAEAKRLRELEAENKKLKKLLAETMLDKVALKDALGRRGRAAGSYEKTQEARHGFGGKVTLSEMF